MYTQSIGAFAPPPRHGFAPRMLPPPHGFVPPSRGPAAVARSGPGHFTPAIAVRPNPNLQAQFFRRNQELFRQRETLRLMQQNRYTREQALIAANAALTAQNASLQAQAAQQAAAAQAGQVPVATQPTVSPAAPNADLTPQQDASDGGAPAPEELPHAKKSHLLLFVGLAAAAGVGGYVFLKKKRGAAKP